MTCVSSTSTGHASARTPRRLSLLGLVAALSTAFGIFLCLAIAGILVANARGAIREEAASAFASAQSAAENLLALNLSGPRALESALRLSRGIDALRHVSAHITAVPSATGQPQPGIIEANTPPLAPQWFARLLRPQIETGLFPISNDPGVGAHIRISSDPSDEIAEIWQDFRAIIPLLAVAGLAMIGFTLTINNLILRRLRRIQDTIGAIRQGDVARRAPGDNLVEFAVLADGVNDLAEHLQAERSDNDLLHNRLLSLSESERAIIASDLHDEMGPQLFALNAALAQAQVALDDVEGKGRGQLEDALAASVRHAQSVCDSARTAICDLRPMLIGHGSLTDLLQDLVADFADIAPRATIRLDGACDMRSDELVELSIYRFVRESVLNAIRHGNADRIDITLHCDNAAPGLVKTRITDNGRGFAGKVPVESYGLIGIKDRARALGAEYLPPYRDGEITITELNVPLP